MQKLRAFLSKGLFLILELVCFLLSKTKNLGKSKNGFKINALILKAFFSLKKSKSKAFSHFPFKKSFLKRKWEKDKVKKDKASLCPK
jgi:hypothetical protein